MKNLNKNPFVPFPRYENAIFIGDSAIETFAELRIYGRALIGGDLPNMVSYHPSEKLLECTACVMRDQRILFSAIRREKVDYVLLENNPAAENNPASLEPILQAKGIPVKILDIASEPLVTLYLAGGLFDEKRRAERAIREFCYTEQNLLDLKPLKQQTVLSLLGIRHPLEDKTFLFALSDVSDVGQSIYPLIGAQNPVRESDFKTKIPGLVEIKKIDALLENEIDWIAVMGDTLGVQQILAAYQAKAQFISYALAKSKIFSVPYYGKPLFIRRPKILKEWRKAAEIAQGL